MRAKVQRREVIENRLIAMTHPVRREVLRILAEGPASPAEIANELALPTANVSHHVNRLVELQCIELVEERKVQGAIQHIYRGTERALVSKDEWDDLHPVEAESFAAEIMQLILDDYLASEKAKIVGHDSDFHLSRTPLSFDLEGLREGVKIFERFRLELEDLSRKSAERSGSATFAASACLGLFRMPGKNALTD
jgi:predicted transcriptional regulator